MAIRLYGNAHKRHEAWAAASGGIGHNGAIATVRIDSHHRSDTENTICHHELAIGLDGQSQRLTQGWAAPGRSIGHNSAIATARVHPHHRSRINHHLVPISL